MSLPLIFHPDVDEDIREARNFYDARRPGLGDAFVAGVEYVQARIAANPRMHQMIWRTVRRGILRRFPYGVFYRVLTDRVEVLAMYHLKRDPKGWQQRA